MIHLDTSFLVRAFMPGTLERERLRVWLRRDEGVALSSVAWGEFLCGPVSGAIEAVVAAIGEPVPFEAADAAVAANLFNASGRRRNSFQDCMIAASAINAGAAIATSNVADFERFVPHGLVLASP